MVRDGEQPRTASWASFSRPSRDLFSVPPRTGLATRLVRWGRGESLPRSGRDLGNLKALDRSNGLDGKEATTHNDDPSAAAYGGVYGGVVVQRNAAGANGQSKFRAEPLLRQRNHRPAD